MNRKIIYFIMNTNKTFYTSTVAKKNSFFITVEGNIGAGKSTFLKKIAESLKCSFLPEPCQEWQNINGHNLLDEFYKDIKRWAYSFQLYAFLARIESIEKQFDLDTNPFFIAERSIFADRYVFAEACYNNKNMSDLEWNMYTKWFDWAIARKANKIIPSAIIYLKVDPLISFDRINQRGRFEEKNIPLEYLQSLDNYHNLWLLDKKNIHDRIKNIPTLVINCNEDFENNSKTWENMVSLVQEFITINFKVSFINKGIHYGSNTSNNYCCR
jgi:deoxyadenosine/deoxycytidine kinase